MVVAAANIVGEPAADALSMMDSAGLDFIVENADYVQKFASALESKNLSVKKQVFDLLSTLCVYSSEGYGRALEAVEYFKSHTRERYRFKFVVSELRNGPNVEYQTAVLAFINCLILANSDLRERIRVRSEFIGLRLLQVLNDLRHRSKEFPDLTVQLDVFEETKENDDNQVGPTGTIDLSSPLEIYDTILRQISDTPQEVPFLSILQHLLRIDPKEPISDLIWDAAERLVHRATLLETPDDALKLLKAPSHSKSLHKLKGQGSSCTCGCHRKSSLASPGEQSGTTGPPPPPPGPPPPPLPPGMPPPPPPPSSSSAKAFPSGPKNDLPKLPQQSIPMPKTKMRTVNWNKIPSGQVLEGDKNNIWAKFAKSQANSNGAGLDWAALEGLFCLQTDRPVPSGGPNGNGFALGPPRSGEGENGRKATKKESGELTLLDAKRSLNINIFLKQFRSSNDDMIQLIMEGCSEDFGVERLRGLLKILPNKDEMEMLRSVGEGDRGRLGNAEKFLLQLISVNGYRLRIEAMLLKEELEACVNNLESSINAILQASQEVKNSNEFQEVIFMILVAGNFLNSQAEARSPKLITFVNELTALEEASKTSIDQLKNEILHLNTKVGNTKQQMENPTAPREIRSQFGQFFQEAGLQIKDLEDYLIQVEEVRLDLAKFFCEDVATFKFEDCFKIINSFTTKWKQAAGENGRRRKQEEEVEHRRRIREEQNKKRVQLGWQSQQSPDEFLSPDRNKPTILTPEDEIFIACSPRIVRRRLGSFNDNNPNGQSSTEHLVLPSPDTTPNGSLRRRRSRVPSDEDESGLMDFLRSSGNDGSRERRPGPDQYGSLDRSWARKTKRRPNLMDFVNDDRERPVSPGPSHGDHQNNNPTVKVDSSNLHDNQKPREWRERISAWFVDLENGNGEKKRPPPRRFQRRFGLESREAGLRGLATLPEGDGEGNPTAFSPPPVNVTFHPPSSTTSSTYQRVYPDRKPSLKLNTDVVGAMEAIEEVQSPVKEKSLWRKSSLTSNVTELKKEKRPNKSGQEDGRRSLIGSLGSKSHDEKLVLYIPEESLPPPTTNKSVRRSPSMRETTNSRTNLENIENHGESGTKDGFDRFASIRRSRRYKKGPELNLPAESSSAPTTPTTPTGLFRQEGQKFVTKVDISSPNEGEPKRRELKTTPLGGRVVRSSSMKVPVGRTGSGDEPSSKMNINPRETANNFPGSKALLTSSGSTEKDEGFEESQSSLSETNSQSESNAVSKSSGKKVGRSESLMSNRGSKNPPPQPPPLVRKKSRQENPPLILDSSNSLFGTNGNKNSSRSSLQSSRSSLTSQTTVNTVVEAKKNPSPTESPRSSDPAVISLKPRPLSSIVSLTPSPHSGNNNRSILGHRNAKNDLYSFSPHAVLGGDKGKSLTPRILSFMRPTASSSAKDKVEPPPKSKGQLKKNFK